MCAAGLQRHGPRGGGHPVQRLPGTQSIWSVLQGYILCKIILRGRGWGEWEMTAGGKNENTNLGEKIRQGKRNEKIS